MKIIIDRATPPPKPPVIGATITLSLPEARILRYFGGKVVSHYFRQLLSQYPDVSTNPRPVGDIDDISDALATFFLDLYNHLRDEEV